METESKRKTPTWSRWRPILHTTPSGKALFVCLVCGQLTPAPGRDCPPERKLPGGASLGLDPRLPTELKQLKPTCRDLERYIDSQIEKHVHDKLVLDWTENKLKPPEERNCHFCYGYGCQACFGKGTL